MNGVTPLIVVCDVPPLTGIATYVDSLVRLMRPILPRIRRVSLYPGSSARENELEIPGLRYAKSTAEVPFAKRWNRLAFSKFLARNPAVLHLAGADYSLVDAGSPAACTVHDYYLRLPNRGIILNPRALATEALTNINNLTMVGPIRRAAGVSCPTSIVQEDLRRRLGLVSRVIPHWVDAQRFHSRPKGQTRRALGLPSSGNLLLNVGGAGSNKNLATMKLVADALPAGWHLLKVGAPLGGAHCVDLGKLDPERYPLVFNAADAYLHPSIEEGFGIPLIESLASGTPVISWRGSTAPEILGDAGLYADSPDDVSGYLEHLRRLSDPQVHREASEASLRRSTLFDSNVARQAYLEFYREALGVTVQSS